ncbi:hypothetical protein ACFO5T_06455 [Dokdonia genika]|jgi:hypothetical protein|uniref:Gliding motility lipoprotein GldD n=1 Tax=Dokdonia genika TaxID=308113 RepID=A0ABV9L8X8_9FLAO
MNLKVIAQLIIALFFTFNCNSQNKIYKTDKEIINSNWEILEFNKINVQLEFPNKQIEISNDKLKTKDYGKALRKTIQWNYLKNDNFLNSFYTFNYIQYPKYKFDITKIDEFYENKIQSLLNDLKGILIYQKNVEYENYAGVEISYSLSGYGVIITQRIFLIDNIEYSLSVFTPEKFENNSLISKFFSSFELK